MNDHEPQRVAVTSLISCLGLALAMLFLCLMPFVLVDAMRQALLKLHLDPLLAGITVLLIFFGGLINIPVYHIPRDQEQIVETGAIYGLWGRGPQHHRVRQDTIIAVNLGGCLVPTVLAGWLIYHLVQIPELSVTVLGIVLLANIIACYSAARPVQGVGIVMPGLLSPLVSVGLTWLLLPGEEFELMRAPVAFVAGVLGPLIGADLLHLRDLSRVSMGMLSIGGAGTFDGIVLSGVLAALIA